MCPPFPAESRNDDIHQALADALGEKKTRIMDRRFLFLLGFVTVALALMFTVLQVQVRGLRAVQQQQVSNCMAQNKALGLLAAAAMRNTTRTMAENQEISRTYLSLVSRCQ